jgi:hypothetical protein
MIELRGCIDERGKQMLLPFLRAATNAKKEQEFQ